MNGRCKDCSIELLKIGGTTSGNNNKNLIGKEGICKKCKKPCLYNNIVRLCENCFREHCLYNFFNIQKGVVPNKYGFDITLSDLNSIAYNNAELDLSDGITSLKYLKNVCGAIGLTGIFKEDGKRYALTAGKSNNIYYEIRKFLRIIEQPEKQIPYGETDKKTNKIDNDYGRWYDITHNYSDFKIELIAKDVSDEEAILCEMKWAIDNNALYKCDNNRKKLPNTHGYWLP